MWKMPKVSMIWKLQQRDSMDLTGINMWYQHTRWFEWIFNWKKWHFFCCFFFKPSGTCGSFIFDIQRLSLQLWGLTYSLGSFHVENDKGYDNELNNDDTNKEKNTMIVWRACGLIDLFASEGGNRHRILGESNNDRAQLLQWERIVPRVDTTLLTPYPPLQWQVRLNYGSDLMCVLLRHIMLLS